MQPVGSTRMVVEPAGEGLVSGPASPESAIGTVKIDTKREAVERRILSLVRRVGYRFIDAEVFVASIEEVEGYDAGFFTLHVVRERFDLSEVDEVRRIIERAGFLERGDVRIGARDGKVELVFDLRW